MSITIREKKLKSGKKSLYLDMYINGKRKYEFLKGMYLTGDKQADKETRELAESIRAKRQLEIAHNAHGFVPAFKQKANFVDYFKKVADSFDTSTEKQYNNVLKKIKSYAGENVAFGSIDRRWLEGFKEHLIKSIGENTARTYFVMLKAALNRAVKDEIIGKNPADKVDNFKKKKKHAEYLTIEELSTLHRTEFDHHDLKPAFLFACYTGLRFSDIEGLRWEQIRNNTIEFEQKKTNGDNSLPLNPQAISILAGQNRNREFVFDLTTNAFCNTKLKEWAGAAGLKRWVKDENRGQKGLTFHVSRHTFAVLLLSNGVDVFTLKKLMGHESIESTMVYADIVNKTKKEAVNKFPDL